MSLSLLGVGAGGLTPTHNCDPLALVCDEFTDSDSTGLENHTPNVDQGSGWGGTATDYLIVSNKVKKETGGSTRAIIDTGSGENHVRAILRFADVSDGTQYGGLVARANAADTTFWTARLAASGDVVLTETATVRASDNIGARSIDTDYLIELICTGTSITFKVDGVSALSHTSASLQAQTYAGIRIQGVDNATLDDFEVLPP